MDVQVLITLDLNLNLTLSSQFTREEGATGFDGDTDATDACRAPGDSLNLEEHTQLPIKNWHSQLKL